eukprot:3938985-Rhodomonas_salina.2
MRMMLPGAVLEAQFMSHRQIVTVAREATILLPRGVAPGQALEITVEDPFAFESGYSQIEVLVSVSCVILPSYTSTGRSSQGDETVHLFVSGSNIHRFTGSLSTFEQIGSLSPNAAQDDGALDLKGKAVPQNGGHCSEDIITVTYAPVTTSHRPVTAQASLTSDVLATYVPVLTLTPSVFVVDGNRSITIQLQDDNAFAAARLEVSIIVLGFPPITTLTLSNMNTTRPIFSGIFTPTRSLIGMDSAQNPVLLDFGSTITVAYFDDSAVQTSQPAASAFATVAQNASLSLSPHVLGTYEQQDVATIFPGTTRQTMATTSETRTDTAFGAIRQAARHPPRGPGC